MERVLRQLDPIDVRSLWGLHVRPRFTMSRAANTKLRMLYATHSGGTW